MNSLSNKSVCLLACVALVGVCLASGQVGAAPLEQQDQEDFADEPTNEFDDSPTSGASQGLQREPSELSGYGGQSEFGGMSGPQGDQYPVSPAASSSPSFGANHALGENNMNTDDDSDADEPDSDIESSTSNQAAPLTASGSSAGAAAGFNGRDEAESAPVGPQNSERELRQWSQDESLRAEQADADADSDAQDSNIANAKIEMNPQDMAPAAGHHHHHHHGHYVHGWLEMGAKTGKKGAFKWHDKHPVGGKGR